MFSWLIVVAVSLFVGYVIGKARNKAPLPVVVPKPAEKALTPKDIERQIYKANLSDIRPHKLALLVRTDLGMTKGKMCAQVGHATLAAVFKSHVDQLGPWYRLGQTKIALKVASLEEMEELGQRAEEAGLVTVSIQDAGRTQIEPGTVTVRAVGPAPASKIDDILGHLKLL
eukprot:TRINITY_DN16435_c0_g1_i1.p1 TRINITY_DN16435_c0_g1~~TRINITY_DN16435_c0_g1_i1.p1  ORF type:complete len:198 (+),score=88.92 TRINITY_DN16435_c0_g1_i1:82-594(+)